MNTKRFALTVFIIAFALASCIGPNFNKASYQSMGVMSTTYEVGLSAAGDLYRRGLISEEGKAAIIKAAKEYQIAHNNSITAFQEYLTAATPDEQENKKLQYIAASKVSLQFYSALLTLLTQNGIYGEPVEPWF